MNPLIERLYEVYLKRKPEMFRTIILLSSLLLGLHSTLPGQSAKKWIRKGLATEDKGKRHDYYKKAVEAEPLNSDAHVYLGNAKYALGGLSGALSEYNKALELDPDNANAYLNRAHVYYFLLRHDESLADYNEAIKTIRSSVKVYLGRSLTNLALENYEDSYRDCSRVIELDPYSAMGYYLRGRAQENMNQFDEAVEDYTKAIELNPFLKEPYQYRGCLHLIYGRLEKARLDLETAIDLDPKYSLAYMFLGMCKMAESDYEGALKDYERCVELDPFNAQAFHRMGDALGGLERMDEADTAYTEAIRLAPDYAIAYFQRGLMRGYRLDFWKAKGDLEKAAKLNVDNDYVFAALGINYANLGYFEAAIEQFSQAAQKTPEKPDNWNNLGYYQMALGLIEEADSAFDQCLEIDSTFAFSLNNRGRIRIMQGKYAEGIQDFNASLEADNSYPWMVLTNRALAWRKLKNYPAAKEDLKAALEKKPDYEQATFYLEELEELVKNDGDDQVLSKTWVISVSGGEYPGKAAGLAENVAKRNQAGFYQYFHKQKRIPAEQIITFSGKGATRKAILDSLSALAKTGRVRTQDLLLFYFSGEGNTRDGEPGIHVGAATGEENRIGDQELLDAINECPAERKVCILDTYFADTTLSPEVKSVINTSRGGHNSSVSFLTNNLFSQTPEMLETIRPVGGMSWFSGFLLSGLRRAADSNKSGVVDLGELYDFLSTALDLETGGEVVPQLSEGSDRTLQIVLSD